MTSAGALEEALAACLRDDTTIRIDVDSRVKDSDAGGLSPTNKQDRKVGYASGVCMMPGILLHAVICAEQMHGNAAAVRVVSDRSGDFNPAPQMALRPDCMV